MSANIEKSDPKPEAITVHFRNLRRCSNVFQPFLALCEVWSGDPSSTESPRLLGEIHRTYRNSASYTPGVPVWIYRDAKTGEKLESFHSETNLREQIVAHYGGTEPVSPKESTYQIWEAAVILVGLPNSSEQHRQATKQVMAVLDRHFNDYSIVPSHGRFRGVSESTLAIYLTPPNGKLLTQVASELRKVLNEDGVGIYFNGKYLRVTADACGHME